MKKLAETKYFRPASDLHLNLDVQKKFNPADLWTPPPLDTDAQTTLVLAGDLWESKKVFSFSGFSWIKLVAAQFQYVIVVLGNHDYYDGRLDQEVNRFNSLLTEQGISNVFLLENSCVQIGNIKVLGATLWADYNKGNAQSMYYAKNGYPDKQQSFLNDYKYIRNKSFQKIHPREVIALHLRSKQFLFENAHKGEGVDKVLVVTHHAPSYQAIPSRYEYEDYGDWKWHKAGAYFSDLSAEIANSEIDLWIHGHTHEAKSYLVQNTPVLVNPRGYGAKESAPVGFQDKLVLDATTLKPIQSKA